MVGDSEGAKRSDGEETAGNTATWRDYIAWTVILVVIIWFPQWTVLTAFIVSLHWVDTKRPASEMKPAWFLGYSLLMFGIELLEWKFRYADSISLSDVFLPGEESPLDMRLVFFGWLLLFLFLETFILKSLGDESRVDRLP